MVCRLCIKTLDTAKANKTDGSLGPCESANFFEPPRPHHGISQFHVRQPTEGHGLFRFGDQKYAQAAQPYLVCNSSMISFFIYTACRKSWAAQPLDLATLQAVLPAHPRLGGKGCGQSEGGAFWANFVYCLVVFVQGLKEHSWKFQVCVGSRGIAGDYSDAREVLRA